MTWYTFCMTKNEIPAVGFQITTTNRRWNTFTNDYDVTTTTKTVATPAALRAQLDADGVPGRLQRDLAGEHSAHGYTISWA